MGVIGTLEHGDISFIGEHDLNFSIPGFAFFSLSLSPTLLPYLLRGPWLKLSLDLLDLTV